MRPIVVVGAIHHDVIVDAPRLPKVDETLVGQSVRYAFGGKGGNQAVAAARFASGFGASVHFAGCVGYDEPGADAVRTLAEAGVDVTGLQRVDEPTGMSVAISLPDGNYGAVIVSSSNLAFDPLKLVLPPEPAVLVLQNELSPAITLAVAQMASKRDATIIMNAAPARPLPAALDTLVDVLVVNRVEAAGLLERDGRHLKPIEAATELRGDRTAAIVTLGGGGLCVATAIGVEALPPHTVAVQSTHGAGDAFIGALSAAIAAGGELIEACRFANAAAALHVASPPALRDRVTEREVRALMAQ